MLLYTAAALGLAVLLGACAGGLLFRQLTLQQLAHHDPTPPEASLFNRLTNCGLGMSALFSIVLAGKYVTVVSYEVFGLTACATGLVALVALLKRRAKRSLVP